MAYLLSERAARGLSRLLSSGTQVGQTRRARPSGAAMVAGTRFHFATTIKKAQGASTYTVDVSGGAVQVGGYTVFVAGATGLAVPTTEQLLCVRVALEDMSGSLEFIAGNTALRAAQADMRYIIFPLYRFSDSNVSVDYRPIPTAGVWETI